MRQPTRLERIKAAVRFYKKGYKQFQIAPPAERGMAVMVPTWPSEGKAAPFIWPEWRMGKPQWRIVNYEAYAQEGYNENAVVYSAIMYKVRSITAAPLRAYKGTEDKPELLPEDHPLQRLVARPNPYMSWSEFQGIAEVYFNLAGNVYIYCEPGEGIVPKALWLLRPDRTYIIPHPDYREKCLQGHPAQGPEEKKADKAILDKGAKALETKKDGDEKLLGFYYIPEGKGQDAGIPYLPKDVIHIKLPNPLDPLDGLGYGIAPLSPASRSADVDNRVTRFLKLFFDQGCMPLGLLKYSIPMDDKQVARSRERWKEIYGGSDKWVEIAVLDESGEYQRLGMTFDEMGFDGLDTRNESRICGPFGVPGALIGTRLGLQRAIRANMVELRKMFWEDTMRPELRWFEVGYRERVKGDRGEFVMFDLSKVPALAPPPKERADIARDAWYRSAITRNEYRNVIGFAPVPDGDVYLVNVNFTEIPAEGDVKRKVLAIVNEAGRQALQARATIDWRAVHLKVWPYLEAGSDGVADSVEELFHQAIEGGWGMERVVKQLERTLS